MSRVRFAYALVLAAACSATAHAQPSAGSTLVDRVRIVGGAADGTGQNYEWTVTVSGSLPLVRIEFPHYHADTFTAPPEWQRDLTNPERPGTTISRGVGVAWVEKDSLHAISDGRSAKFSMRVARVGADRRRGNVTVTFADGSVVTISGVELPSEASFGERYGMTIGIGVLLAAFLAYQVRRRMKSTASNPPPAAP